MKVVATRLDVASATLVTTLQPETERDYHALGLIPPGWIVRTVVFYSDHWSDLQRWADDGGRV